MFIEPARPTLLLVPPPAIVEAAAGGAIPRAIAPLDEEVTDLRWLTRTRKKDPRTIPFRQLLEEWLAQRPECSDSRSAVRKWFRPCFGHLRDVRLLTPENVVGFLEVLELDEKKAQKTIAKLLSFLSTIFELGLETGACELNITRSIPRSKRPSSEVVDPDRAELEVLTRRQVTRVSRSRMVPYWHSNLFELALFTGLRFGEAAGVSWADVVEEEAELEDGRREMRRYLYVRKQFSSKKRRLTPPKTKRPKRVPVCPTLWARLQQTKRRFRTDFGRDPDGTDPIAPFVARCRVDNDQLALELLGVGGTVADGGRARWREKTALAWWRRHLVRLGIPHPPTGARKFHATRHSFISLLIELGAPAPAVREITHKGRANRDAFWLYVHANFKAVYAAAQLLTHDPEVLAECEAQAELL